MVLFSKYHGCGNSFVIIREDELSKEIDEAGYPGFARMVCDVNTGVGADGMIVVRREPALEMVFFNRDGSRAPMCGNGIRCVGKFLYDKGIVNKTEITVDTLSGIKTLKLNITDNKVDTVCVDMGKAILEPKLIPVKWDGDTMINEPVTVMGKEYRLTAVSMGNPHAVCFIDDVDGLDLEKIGPYFENMDIFPDRVNTEFVRVIDEKTLQMRVWERGSGETFACGTGTCATVVAACLNGICKMDTDVTVHLVGGDLIIRYCSDGTVFMTGKAETAYEGVFEYEYKN